MSAQIEDGGSAFPEVFTDIKGERGDYHSDTYSAGGMTLRDYFAAHALPGLQVRSWDHIKGDGEILKHWAASAYAVADEMLKARQS